MSQTRYILAGCLIDGSGGTPRRNVYLAVQDGIISAIGPAAALPSPDLAKVKDLSHCVIVPALVDCSLTLSRSPSVDPAVRLAAAEAGLTEKAALWEQHVRYCHAHGVLGVADGNDDPLDLTTQYRKRPENERLIDICSAGRICRSLEEFETMTARGCDYLKIGYSDDIEDGGGANPQLNYDDLCQIIRRRKGKKAVVVANGRERVAEALRAGCDAIEQGYAIGEENLKTMAENKVLWIPGVLRAKNSVDGSGSGGDVACRFSQRYVAPGKGNPGAETYWKKTLDEQLTQLHLARSLGVTTAVGTGAGGIGILHGEAMVEEMKLFIKAGYSLPETIRCATAIGATFFGFERLGELAVGRRPTFLITRGTAQQLPRKLSFLEGIYGEKYSSAEFVVA